MELPLIISVDDHVLEPGDLWTAPAPRNGSAIEAPTAGASAGVTGQAASAGSSRTSRRDWADVWRFEGYEMSIIPGFAAAGMDQDQLGEHWHPMTYDEMRPGCYDQAARLADLDTNHTEASLSFPTFPRFCGQTFLEQHDQGARPGVRAGLQRLDDRRVVRRRRPRPADPADADPAVGSDAGRGRGAAVRGQGIVRRCLLREPAGLDLPSIHTTHWDPFSQACEDTDTVVNMHIGSSSYVPDDVHRRAAGGVVGAHLPGCDPRPRRLAHQRRARAVRQTCESR